MSVQMGKKKKQIVESDSDSDSDAQPRYHVDRLHEKEEVRTQTLGLAVPTHAVVEHSRVHYPTARRCHRPNPSHPCNPPLREEASRRRFARRVCTA